MLRPVVDLRPVFGTKAFSTDLSKISNFLSAYGEVLRFSLEYSKRFISHRNLPSSSNKILCTIRRTTHPYIVVINFERLSYFSIERSFYHNKVSQTKHLIIEKLTPTKLFIYKVFYRENMLRSI